jgi:ubiquitin-like protein ATG12
MTASTVLMALPRDATAALAAAGGFPQEKIVVRFKPVGSAPPIRRDLVKVASVHKFESVVAYLRKTLKVGETESVFLYVNSTFAPALDEVVGNLWRVGLLAPRELGEELSADLHSASKTPTTISMSRIR